MKNIFLFLATMSTCLLANPSIVIQVEENLQEVGRAAAELLLTEINIAKRQEKQLALLLPTGSTAISMYAHLVKLFYEGKADFSKVTFFNLDEYVGLAPDHPQSYAYYMDQHLYGHITKGLTLQKLKYFGLTPLTKRECFNPKTLNKLNESIQKFCEDLIQSTQGAASILKTFDQVVEKHKKENRFFHKLTTDYMNDKTLPSIETLRKAIAHSITLKTMSASKKNIHVLDGLASNLKEQAENYHKALKKCLNDPKFHTVCVAGIGIDPAHIAFNEFITEEPFLQSAVSEVQKNQQALNSITRVVPLAKKTRESNAKYFGGDYSKVPHHAITVGLQEILECDKMMVLAAGTEKKDPLYNTFANTPSFQIPSSFLPKYFRSNLYFIVDEKAYGFGEEKSLFTLNTLKQLKNGNQAIPCILSNHSKTLFWDVPNQKKPVLLDKGYKISHPDVILASLPKNQTILWVKNSKTHLSLWQELKENHNEIHVVQKESVDEILASVDKYEPDILILPYTYSLIEQFSQLKSEINKRFPTKPILGIFYETRLQLNNAFFPMNREEQKNKINAINRFHHTQVSRTQFNLIAEEMALSPSAVSSHNETFNLFHLQSEKGLLKLTPFQEKTYIIKSDEPNKKLQKLPHLTFSERDVAVIVSPHPDDVEISLGGLIQHLGKEQVYTSVLNATSGHNAVIKKSHVLTHPYLPSDILLQAKCETSKNIESKALKSRIRECESLGALNFLNPDIQIQFLRLPFYDHLDQKLCDEDIYKADDAIAKAVGSRSGRIFFFIPYPQDSQPTHQMIHKLFINRIYHFYQKHLDRKVIVAFYPTPWTGNWNLYDYSYNQGSKLAALVGSELLLGNGVKAAKPESLGGIFACRYHLFYFND